MAKGTTSTQKMRAEATPAPKRGRPRKHADDVKRRRNGTEKRELSETITIRCTPEWKAEQVLKADMAGMVISEYGRRCMDGRRTPDRSWVAFVVSCRT